MKRMALNSVIIRFIGILLLVLVVPFSFVLALTANRLSDMEKQNANQYLASNLHTVSSTMDQALMNLEGVHTLMYLDRGFMNGLKRLAPYDEREEYSDYKNTNGIKSCINSVASLNDYIYSIYAYSFTAERFFSSKVNWNPDYNHFTSMDAPWLQNYLENRLSRPWQVTQSIGEERTILTCYRELWAYGVDEPISLLSINIDTDNIAKMLSGVISVEDGFAFIIDDFGNIISEGEDEIFGTITGYLQPISSEGFFDFTYNGREMFVSYYTSPYSGLKFVVAAPLNRIQTSVPVMRQLIALFLLLLAIMVAAALLLARHYFWTPVRALFAGMRRVQDGDFAARLPANPTYEFGYINSNFNSMADNIGKLIDENYTSKLINQEARLKNLQDQLNEHFLYNTLDSIHWLARKENASQASDMVFALANFYRTSLSSGRDVIPVREVVEMMGNYLYIQKIRMRDNLNYSLNCDSSLKEEPMPKGLLQPLAENALLHGMKELDKPGELNISLMHIGGVMRVSVQDNGHGFPPERLAEVREQLELPEPYCEHSFALKALQSQLRLYYHVNNAVHIKTAPGEGTVIWFEVPLSEGGVQS